MRFSWDKASQQGVSFAGWHIENLLRALLEAEARRKCSACTGSPKGDCSHLAAQCVLDIISVVEHPPDCPECNAAAKQRSQSQAT